jgi:outer membrane receptor protein involved in Fe transport
MTNPYTRPLKLFAFLALTQSAFSQTMTTGDVIGIVTDPSGRAVPTASIKIRRQDTNETRTALSGESGQFRFSLLPSGSYAIEASSSGLRSDVEEFTLLIGQETGLNIRLNVQAVQEVIEVGAQAAVLQTENANLTTVFDAAQVASLPMNGGDVTTLAFTVPGVLVLPGGGTSGNFSVNGISGASTLFTLNGADNMDPYLNINNSGPSNNTLGANEVGEAAVVLNAYSASYGRMAGAQVNFVGKSGGNAFHGNLFETYNDAIFNANDFFNNASGTSRGRADANQFGGAVSGPLRRNKLFFLFNLEGLRYVLPYSGLFAVPSPELEQYALQHIPASAVPIYNDAIKLWNNAPGLNRAVPVSTGNGPLQDSSGALGCGNFKFRGTSAPGGGAFGVNVACALAFGTNVSEKNIEGLITARLDYNLSPNQKINFRYNYDWGLQATTASPLNPAFDVVSHQPSHQGQLNYTYVIRPTLVNSFIGSGSWYSAIFGVADFRASTALQPEALAISDNSLNSAVWATAGGNGGFPNGRNVGQTQLVDDLTWVHNRHSVKSGVNYRFNKVTDTSIASSSQRGVYTFADITDFAAGTLNTAGHGGSFAQNFPGIYAAHIRLSALGWYIEDEWKLRRNLNLTMGLRMEHNSNPACVDNCFSRMNVQFGMPGYQGGAAIPYNQTISTGLHTAYKSEESVITEPRFGFAWTPFGAGKTVIRGGVGWFSNLSPATVIASVFGDLPNKFTPSVSFGAVGLPSDSGSSAAAAMTSFQSFIKGFTQGLTLGQIQASLGKVPFTAPTYYSPPDRFLSPKVAEWSLEIEQPLTPRNVLALTYAGNHGFDQSVTNSWSNSFLLLNSSGVNATYGTSFAGLPTAAPDPRFLTVSQVLAKGFSNYESGTLQLRHAFSNGFQGQVFYTWSHSLGIIGVYNPGNFNFGYGNLSIDVRSAVAGDLVWKPGHKFTNRAAAALLGGWNFGGKFYVYSGRPFSITDSRINAQVNSGGGLGTFLATAMAPDAGSHACTYISGSPGSPCFTAGQFETYAASTKVGTPVQMDFGQTGPGSFRGPGYFDIDIQTTRKFRVFEHLNFEFGAQIYNILNHPNFRNPGSNVGSPSSLGVISADYSPPASIYGSGQGAAVSGRVLELMGRFNF